MNKFLKLGIALRKDSQVKNKPKGGDYEFTINGEPIESGLFDVQLVMQPTKRVEAHLKFNMEVLPDGLSAVINGKSLEKLYYDMYKVMHIIEPHVNPGGPFYKNLNELLNKQYD